MGHAGGMSMSDVCQATISPYVSNALPRNCSYENIVVPLQLRDSTVAFSVPYYIAVKQEEELKATSPPHNACTALPTSYHKSKGRPVNTSN